MMKKTRKGLIGLIGCLVGLLVVVMASTVVRLRHSVVVHTEETDMIPHQVVLYRQDDVRWAEDRLGVSSFTMESSGCLVSCIASAVSMEKGQTVTPGELNQIFSEHNVYDGEGNLQWSALEKIGAYSVNVYQEVSQEEIDRCLEAGHYPIVRVRVNGIGNYHYVLIVGAEDRNYICMDPLADELTKLSRYLNRVYAVRLVM